MNWYFWIRNVSYVRIKKTANGCFFYIYFKLLRKNKNFENYFLNIYYREEKSAIYIYYFCIYG